MILLFYARVPAHHYRIQYFIVASVRKRSPFISLYVQKAEKNTCHPLVLLILRNTTANQFTKQRQQTWQLTQLPQPFFAGHLTVLSAPEKNQKPRTARRNAIYAGARWRLVPQQLMYYDKKKKMSRCFENKGEHYIYSTETGLKTNCRMRQRHALSLARYESVLFSARGSAACRL